MIKQGFRYIWVAYFALVAGCAGPAFEETASGEFGDAGLYPVTGTGFDEVHARRDAHLATYRQILAEDIDLSEVRFDGPMLSGTTAGQWQITERRAETLTDAWRGAVELAFGDYQQVEQGDPVLRIVARLVAVQRRNASFTGTLPAGVQSSRRDSIAVHIEIELYDLASGRLLSVVRDRRDRHTEEWTRGSGQLMRNLFNSWATLLEARIAGAASG